MKIIISLSTECKNWTHNEKFTRKGMNWQNYFILLHLLIYNLLKQNC